MKTTPSDVFLLDKIDGINTGNHNRGATVESISSGIDSEHSSYLVRTLHKLEKMGVIKSDNDKLQPAYKVTGYSEGASEEIKHYVKHRKIPE